MPVNILLIDDETDYSETMQFWLMAKGYSVRTCASGMLGLKAIKEERPGIVFLDMQMPEMDGIRTLRVIRSEYPDLPVIMVTAYATEEKKREAMEIGAGGFFSKGEDFNVAARLISEVLARIRE